jgi:hypothetical protein
MNMLKACAKYEWKEIVVFAVESTRFRMIKTGLTDAMIYYLKILRKLLVTKVTSHKSHMDHILSL